MLTLRYNEPVFILMLRGRVGCLRPKSLQLRVSRQLNNVPAQNYHKYDKEQKPRAPNRFDVKTHTARYRPTVVIQATSQQKTPEETQPDTLQNLRNTHA